MLLPSRQTWMTTAGNLQEHLGDTVQCIPPALSKHLVSKVPPSLPRGLCSQGRGVPKRCAGPGGLGGPFLLGLSWGALICSSVHISFASQAGGSQRGCETQQGE